MPIQMRGFRIANDETVSMDFRVFPSADLLVNRWVTRGIAKNTISAGADATVCSAAIIASAIEIARQRQSRVISVSDVRTGWKEILAYDLCVPPWRCLARSITDRLDHVRSELPALEQILEQMRQP